MISNKQNKARKNNKKSLRRPRKGNSGKRNNNSKQISAPSAMGRVLNVTGANDFRVKKREYITDLINSSTDKPGLTFRRVSNGNGLISTIASLAVNAGLAGVFPWLSSAAQCFEQFVFHTLKFEYVPSCSTSTPGSVAIAPSYDANRPLPVEAFEKSDYLDRVGTVRTPVWSGASCSLPQAKLNSAYKSHYIRSGTSDVSDLARTDAAVVDIVIDKSITDGDNIGELWVEYDVSLKIPKGNSLGSSVSGFEGNETIGTGTAWGTLYASTPSIGVPYAFRKISGAVGHIGWYPEPGDIGCYRIDLVITGTSPTAVTAITSFTCNSSSATLLPVKKCWSWASASNGTVFEFTFIISVYFQVKAGLNSGAWVSLGYANTGGVVTYQYVSATTSLLSQKVYDLSGRDDFAIDKTQGVFRPDVRPDHFNSLPQTVCRC